MKAMKVVKRIIILAILLFVCYLVWDLVSFIIKDFETKRSELTESYNKAQKQLDEAKFSMMTADAGAKIKYRQQVEKLQTETQRYASELDKINAQIGYQTEKAVNNLMMFNLLYCPLLILAVIGVLCWFLRNRNLKRIK